MSSSGPSSTERSDRLGCVPAGTQTLFAAYLVIVAFGVLIVVITSILIDTFFLDHVGISYPLLSMCYNYIEPAVAGFSLLSLVSSVWRRTGGQAFRRDAVLSLAASLPAMPLIAHWMVHLALAWGRMTR